MLGNRSLKLKYLNPNTLFVATGTPPGVAKGTARHITAHIFDTVTGQLLYSQSHEVGGCIASFSSLMLSLLWHCHVILDFFSLPSHSFPRGDPPEACIFVYGIHGFCGRMRSAVCSNKACPLIEPLICISKARERFPLKQPNVSGMSSRESASHTTCRVTVRNQ